MKDELIERLNVWPGGIGRLDTLNATFVGGIMSEAADAGAADNARVAAALALLDDIKQEALTAGSPGHRTSAKALAHIVRLCIDARAILKETPDAK